MLVLMSEEPCYRQKTPLVLGRTRTQVFAVSMAIAPPRVGFIQSISKQEKTYTLNMQF